MAPFRRVGLADEDRPRRPHPGGQQIIGLRDEVGVER